MFFRKKRNFDTIDLPFELRGQKGIFAAPINSISLNKSFSGTVLCIQDEAQNIKDLSKIKKAFLQVKVGAVHTSHGMVVFILFIFWDTDNENDKFTYEVLINPSDISSFEQYLIIDEQLDWKVLVIHDNDVFNTFKFKNIYKIGGALENAIDNCKKFRCDNFEKAKEDYFRKYDVDELIKL